MTIQRISFFVERAEPHSSGWLVLGEAGYSAEFLARPGDRFEVAAHPGQADVAVNLMVLESSATRLVVTGDGGSDLRKGDILVGTRRSGA